MREDPVAIAPGANTLSVMNVARCRSTY